MIVLKKINRRKNVTTEKLETSRCPCSIRLRKWLPIRLVKCFPIVGLVGQGGSSDEACHSVKNSVHQPTPAATWRKTKLVFWKKARCQFWSWPAPLEEEEPEEANSPNVDAATWRKTNEKKSNYFSHDNICHQWEEEHFLQEEKRKRGCVLTWGKAASPGKRLPTSFVTLGTTFWTFLFFSQKLKASLTFKYIQSSLYHIKGLSYTVLVERLFVDFLCFTCPSPPLWLLK